jgi:proteasome lid subunit RPN8/RPN11
VIAGEVAAALREALAGVARAAEAEPDREACGLVLREALGALSVEPIPNDADRWAAAEPARFPGGARSGFVLAPRPLRQALSAAHARGAVLHAIYHSHVEAAAEPSARDLAEAFLDGEPVLPGVENWIVPVWGGRAGAVLRFTLRGGAFEPAPALPDAP